MGTAIDDLLPSDLSYQTVAAEPALGRLLIRSATTSRSRRGGDLPRTALRRHQAAIDADHVADYARTCGFPFSHVLPATYLHMLAFPLSVSLMVDDAFPFALPGLVHVANYIRAHRPVTLDERVDLAVATVNLRPHKRGHAFDVVATASVAEQTVWHSVSTYLKRGAPAAEDAAAGDDPAMAAVGAVDVESLPLTAIWRVPSNAGRRYGAVSGDRNPIHLHALGARPLGFRSAIAHGMWTAARALAGLSGRLPTAFDYSVAFRKPVRLPSTVHYASMRQGGTWQLGLRSRKGKVHLQGLVTPPS